MRVHLAQIFFNNRTGCFARCLVTELLNVNTARMRLCHQDNQEPDMQYFLPLYDHYLQVGDLGTLSIFSNDVLLS